jgi:hypothetical protein
MSQFENAIQQLRALLQAVPNGLRENRRSLAQFASQLIAGGAIGFEKRLSTQYLIECYGPDGKLKWAEKFHNLVVTAGLTDSLDKHFKGSSYTAAWYVGLTGTAPTFAAGDTMASHGGWTESAAYSQATRPALTLGTVTSGSVDNSASKAVFSINGGATIGGAFLNTVNTKSGSTGTLYGGGAFTAGDRAVLSGDTLNVTVTLTASAS